MADYFSDSIGLQTSAYTAVASIAALLFDFSITFDSEVRLTWGRKWGITRIAFIVSRYLPFAGLAMTVYCEHSQHFVYSCPLLFTGVPWIDLVESTHGGISNHGKFTAVYDGCVYKCIIQTQMLNLFLVIRWLCIAAAGVLLVARVYVISGCERRFLAAVLVYAMAISVAVLIISYIDAIKSGDSTRGVFEERRNASIIYGLLMFGELALMSLTLFKRFKSYQLKDSLLLITLCQDGIIYMLCIILVSMANCVTIAVLPSSYTALLAGPQLVVHSVLASRILFNLRAMSDLQDVGTGEPVVSVVGFSRPMVFQTPSCVDHAQPWDLPK
ncbi:uncharacterized protein EDB91DRAFT_1171529 [Suillus paluster]|uniref:uncharacterized protein n=1 Tax=Suillus paluster TaxID=48578 RepID=UPI001B870C76|nr:uncharacterized protein EDB91DRAFT_1171529 [Suillus paluster]KAG1724098.1 hypothetical protein EDB91DRAFT_1171529 [Suillus paluster]